MRRNIIYTAAHVLFSIVLFWLLTFLPDLGAGREWEHYSMELLFIWYPAACIIGGVLAGLIPRVPRKTRVLCAVLLALIGAPGVALSGVCRPAGIALEVMIYASGVLLGRLFAGVASTCRNNRIRSEKR